MKKEILNLIEKETYGTCFSSQKYSIDIDRISTITYDTEREIVVEKSGETEETKSYIDLTNKAKVAIKYEPLFRYFLDGSRRVYKIDDISYNNKVYPIITGQVGVGCCKRENKKIHKQHFKKENIIVLPIDAYANGNKPELFFGNIKNQINKVKFLTDHHIKIDKILYYVPKKDADSKDLAVAKIQDRMIELEKDMVAELVESNLLNKDNYLIKDGSLEYKEYASGKNNDNYTYAKIRNNYRYVVGVSKSFNPSLARTKNKKSMAKFIADLPLFHRTPAIMYESSHTGQEKFSIWYLRIRSPEHCQSPFDGIIKVEKLLIHNTEKTSGLDSEIIDSISAYLINERNPVCYGSDNRWANHLYPIYLTESFVKSQYLSSTFFLNMF